MEQESSRRIIRNELHFDVGKSLPSSWDDKIASRIFNADVHSHISFVKQTHRVKSKFKEARHDVNAATFTLSIIIDYYRQGIDKLFQEFFEQYQAVILTGAAQYIDCCKEILQFVKYPEGKELSYTQYTYDQLLSLALYTEVTQYPPQYIMYYDIINEFDLKLTDRQKSDRELDYARDHLSLEPYTSADNSDIAFLLEPSMYAIAKRLSRRKVQEIRTCILNASPIVNRRSYISNAICALGSKRDDFYVYLAKGVTQAVYDLVDKDFNTIEKLYGITLERPPIDEESGVKVEQYLAQMIVREDPKKPRDAFASNPVKDTIGFVGMDILAHIFKVCPWIQCGRKRDDQTDMLIDKHRFEEIKKVFLHNKQHHRDVISSDLTKATEHLNMITSMKIITRLLVVITKLPTQEVDTWVQLTFSQLGNAGMTLQHHPGLGALYSDAGQLQGVPGSFHAMTIVLALCSFQACLDKGFSIEDTIYSIQNNGDDGTIPEIAFSRFIELLEKITGPEVINLEKSFSTRINQSLEFCKTIFYSTNEDLITGYRFSTVYKMLSNPSALVHTVTGGFDREKYIFSKISSLYHDCLGIEEEGELTIIAWEFYENVSILNRALEIDSIKQRIAITRLMLNKGIPTFNPYQRKVCPDSWVELLHSRKSFIVKDNLLWSDMKVLRDYIYNDRRQLLPIPEYLYYLMEEDDYRAVINNTCLQNNLDPLDLGYTIHEGDNRIESHTITLPTPRLVRQEMGLSDESVIILEPRFATNIQLTHHNDEIIAELIHEESIQAKLARLEVESSRMSIKKYSNTISDIEVTIMKDSSISREPHTGVYVSNIQRRGHNWPRN